jgi:hypothetical protein
MHATATHVAPSPRRLLAGVAALALLAQGQLHPRVEGTYNALHRVWGPLLLAALVAAGVLGTGFLVGALAWGLHIAIDRVAGYGLRSPDGFGR